MYDAKKDSIVIVYKRIVLISLLLLTSCDDSIIARDLDQRQVNEIVTLLGTSGINPDVEKDHGPRGKYSVSVPEAQYIRSVELLHAAKLPGEPGPVLADLLSAKGILPASRAVEDMRLDYALGLELRDLIEALPGISKASFVVRLRSLKDTESKGVVATVSQFSDSKVTAEEITDLILKTVGSLDREKIIVSLSVIPSALSQTKGNVSAGLVPFLGIWNVPESEYISLAISLLALLVFIGVASLMVGFYAGKRAIIREVFSAEDLHSGESEVGEDDARGDNT